MLRIYPVILEIIRALRPLLRAIERHDVDLAKQLKRASASMALNTAEGTGSWGGVRVQRYKTALGSTRESTSCLEVADAAGYVTFDPKLRDKLEHVAATLTNLVR
jgi:four helix bundle protein